MSARLLGTSPLRHHPPTTSSKVPIGKKVVSTPAGLLFPPFSVGVTMSFRPQGGGQNAPAKGYRSKRCDCSGRLPLPKIVISRQSIGTAPSKNQEMLTRLQGAQLTLSCQNHLQPTTGTYLGPRWDKPSTPKKGQLSPSWSTPPLLLPGKGPTGLSRYGRFLPGFCPNFRPLPSLYPAHYGL
ncbi:hypothetical protein GWK47_020127 [Chionoecetes opilio]|uniref:Uncharacterized protein n=1 Tax=Chionoecetes opilio TaxID=41210 RepID=A0A8J4XQ48_CHIOP|nr:hypothetical protein GWK47_020127 [Chionoecetes opilio]